MEIEKQRRQTEQGTIPERENNDQQESNRKKKQKTNGCSEQSRWANIPYDLLYVITSYLTTADFLSISRICQSWRKFFHATKQHFMESQPPLVLSIPSKGNEFFYLRDVFSPVKYKINLPYFSNNYCRGISNGYLITQDSDNNILLINPVTGNLIKFPPMPKPNPILQISDRAIVASIESNPDNVLLVVLSYSHSNLHFCRSRDKQWCHSPLEMKPWFIRDIVVSKGRIYFMTHEFQVGVLNLRSSDLVLLRMMNSIPVLSTSARFVASSDRILVVDFRGVPPVKVYEIDFSRMEWIELKNLGDDALFFGYKMCLKLRNTSRWGGRSNRVYHIPFLSKFCCMHSLDGKTRDRLPIGRKNDFPNGNYWYFPHQSHSMDVVKDDDLFSDSSVEENEEILKFLCSSML